MSDWDAFYKATKDNLHWPRLERAAALVGRAGAALDLGAGAGRDTRYLLAHGWQVTAVDQEPGSIALLKELPQERLQTIQTSFEDFTFAPETYDLINAHFALPFVPREKFTDVFSRIKQAIKPGGAFTGQFFGIHDEWNTPDCGMTFLTREEALACLDSLTVR